ncbi:FtsW/RodA/SpoVE family cell cycle protein [Caulobacter sp. NIBR2454]|uniref:FtsW/RodA/SpoVE family cell cycle protein n=1 Tax=Caulobacter sp. NIBR2454 TaxID=3015996 RepID=UPI0022B6EF73|nr:FtsW/RodA/SpoVE family cell cycle protein [Caulobacter sp. NIBR2454]
MTGRPAAQLWALLALQIGLTLAASLLAIRAAGASSLMLAVQAGAGVVAVILLIAAARWAPARDGAQTTLVMAVCLGVLILTLLFGITVDGATRWIAIGPLLLHLASIFLPAAVWTFALRPATLPSLLLCAGIAAVLAAQPDGGAAVAFALAVVARLWVHRARLDLASAAVALIAAVWAWTRPDSLLAVSYVEEVVSTAFAALPVVGVFAGLMLALLPAPFLIAGFKTTSAAPLALGALWGGFILAGIFGNFPTPVIGYGASPLLGWCVSFGLLLAHLAGAKASLSAEGRP